MSRKQNITETEWPILEALWASESATAAEIYESVRAKRAITEKTVKSLIRRLIAKNLVSFTVDPGDARLYHYRALADQAECLKEKADSMVQLLYGGKVGNLFEHFVKDLKPEEVSQIERILARKKRSAG